MKHWLIALAFLTESISAEVVTDYISNGDPSDRIDIVVMGDGFTRNEMSEFRAAAASTVEALFSEDPFSSYSFLFNAVFIDVESAESGADHPSRDEYKDTALGAAYDCLDIERLVCIDNDLATAVLNSNLAPEQQDILIVLVNDQQYGGSGGYFAVASVNGDYTEVMKHEIGHAFGDLGDEYWIEGDSAGEGLCEVYGETDYPNTSRTYERDQIPWNEGGGPPTGWIENSQTLPSQSQDDLVDTQTVGAYLGGNHCEDQYRPTDWSKMRDHSEAWGPVNSDILIGKIHSDSNIIQSYSPPNSAPISELTAQSTLSISVFPGVSVANEISWMKYLGATTSPNLPITFNETISSSLVIANSGEVSLDTFSVDVDISHTYRGDLVIKLMSPAGTSVVLHDQIGGSEDDLIGNFPESLNSSMISGGSAASSIFSALEGELLAGEWVLSVADMAAGDDGLLNSWSINFDSLVIASGSNSLDLNSVGTGTFKIKATVSDPNSSIRMSATRLAAQESVIWPIAIASELTAGTETRSSESRLLALLNTVLGITNPSEKAATSIPPISREAAREDKESDSAESVSIPFLPMFALFILSVLMALFGIRRLGAG